MDKSPDPMNTTHQLELPSWLTPALAAPESPQHSPLDLAIIQQGREDKRALEEQRNECAFDRVLETIARGNPLSAALENEVYEIDYPRYLSWIMRDMERKRRYYEAQETGAEVVSHQMIKIADADDSVEDVARSTLRINTRKWLMGVWNRKRFGDIKQIEQNVTIDLSEAMRVAQERVDSRIVDVQARVIR